jgi:D-sedoheptulose 7-phosphate isomerase
MIVFTNGCFDILHPGHVDLLERARALGNRLIVGINSDSSVRSIKGPDRPIIDQESRAAILRALRSVDEVVIFDEPTPERLIAELRPDVLVKGGDWTPDEIIGADLVQSWGGKVVSLPLVPGYSSSKIISRFVDGQKEEAEGGRKDRLASLSEHLTVFEKLGEVCSESMIRCFQIISETFSDGKKLLICGNGGSAADSQHLAAEFVGRFESERRAFPAIALTTDTSALTALANDYSFERVFSRQVEALGNAGDCLLAISTSGNSPNVIAAVMEARKRQMRVIGLTGASGKKLASLCDACVMVPSGRTARIQEAHITIAHIWCELLDSYLQ